MGYYLMAWGMFTGLMFVATLRINRSLQAVFLRSPSCSCCLPSGESGGRDGAASPGKIAGWEGIFVGLTAIYGSIAQVWNELYGRVVLPLGPHIKK